jgi:hypothetical protein
VCAGRPPEQVDVRRGVEHQERPALAEAGVGRPLRVLEHPVDRGRVHRLRPIAPDHPTAAYDLSELHAHIIPSERHDDLPCEPEIPMTYAVVRPPVCDPRRLDDVVR